ncbi:hypothetical protein [Nannocystis pusilla]|uniref:hypothetical protein n=1 Tax=Nannocystis pusilla TaxID=889268 RepID=UPI003B7A5A68
MSDKDGYYYLLGPEGTSFAAPVTVKFPSDAADPAITWDGKIIPGVHDGLGRIVVENDHFSCNDDVPKETVTKVTDGVYAYEAHLCGADYSLVIVDLHDSRVAVTPCWGTPSGKSTRASSVLGSVCSRRRA